MCGCVSVEFVRKDLLPTKQALLRYLPPSSEKREAEARELLKKQATEFCEGEYDITKEYQAMAERSSSVGVDTGFNAGGGANIIFSRTHRHETMYNFVEVICK